MVIFCDNHNVFYYVLRVAYSVFYATRLCSTRFLRDNRKQGVVCFNRFKAEFPIASDRIETGTLKQPAGLSLIIRPGCRRAPVYFFSHHFICNDQLVAIFCVFTFAFSVIAAIGYSSKPSPIFLTYCCFLRFRSERVARFPKGHNGRYYCTAKQQMVVNLM